MNKQEWFKVQVKTAPRCDATGFKCLYFTSFSLKTETHEVDRLTPEYCVIHVH